MIHSHDWQTELGFSIFRTLRAEILYLILLYYPLLYCITSKIFIQASLKYISNKRFFQGMYKNRVKNERNFLSFSSLYPIFIHTYPDCNHTNKLFFIALFFPILEQCASGSIYRLHYCIILHQRYSGPQNIFQKRFFLLFSPSLNISKG